MFDVNIFIIKAPFVSRKITFGKMTYEKTFYGKKKEKKKTRKIFTFFKSVRHFTEKWFDFQLTRKMFSVDHLFSVKQTPENTENIFSETNGP